jgi:hypothetical protein
MRIQILIFFADLGADPDPDFYLMWMRIQVAKMMRIRIHNTAFGEWLVDRSLNIILNYQLLETGCFPHVSSVVSFEANNNIHTAL